MFSMVQLTFDSPVVFPVERDSTAQDFKANHAKAPYIRVVGNRTIRSVHFGRGPSKAGTVGGNEVPVALVYVMSGCVLRSRIPLTSSKNLDRPKSDRHATSFSETKTFCFSQIQWQFLSESFQHNLPHECPHERFSFRADTQDLGKERCIIFILTWLITYHMRFRIEVSCDPRPESEPHKWMHYHFPSKEWPGLHERRIWNRVIKRTEHSLPSIFTKP